MKIAIVGVRGIPNSYGGFETLAEYLTEYLSKDLDITVFCSSKDMKTKSNHFKGAALKYIPISSHGFKGMIYDSISLFQAVLKFDKVLFLGFGAGFIIPFLKKNKSKIILNIGGLDWKRTKWSPFARMVIKKAEALLVKFSGQIVSDNIGIQNYLLEKYGRKSTLIAYGGDQAQKRNISEEMVNIYPFLKSEYAFSVTRIQPDNNIEMILNSIISANTISLVMVGNWKNSKYGESIKKKYSNEKKLILIDAIYERLQLDILRSNCTFYIHGHSAGGTNPSLVEAMYLGLPVFAFASNYNEYTTENKALYFKNASDLSALTKNYSNIKLSAIGLDLKKIAEKNYRWQIIAEKYKKVILQ